MFGARCTLAVSRMSSARCTLAVRRTFSARCTLTVSRMFSARCTLTVRRTFSARVALADICTLTARIGLTSAAILTAGHAQVGALFNALANTRVALAVSRMFTTGLTIRACGPIVATTSTGVIASVPRTLASLAGTTIACARISALTAAIAPMTRVRALTARSITLFAPPSPLPA
jgi:hypothetical protein